MCLSDKSMYGAILAGAYVFLQALTNKIYLTNTNITNISDMFFKR